MCKYYLILYEKFECHQILVFGRVGGYLGWCSGTNPLEGTKGRQYYTATGFSYLIHYGKSFSLLNVEFRSYLHSIKKLIKHDLFNISPLMGIYDFFCCFAIIDTDKEEMLELI